MLRLYEEKADKLVPIDISSNPLARTFSQVREVQGQRVPFTRYSLPLSPCASTSQAALSGFTQPGDRDEELSNLLGHPVDGDADGLACHISCRAFPLAANVLCPLSHDAA